MHSQGRLDPCPGLLPAPCMSLDSSSKPSLMSVKAPCVQKDPILPGAEHPPHQPGHSFSPNTFIMLQSLGLSGEHMFMWGHRSRKHEGGFLWHTSLEQHMGTTEGCTGTISQQNKPRKKVPPSKVNPTCRNYILWTFRSFLGIQLCHHSAWDALKPPSFEN